MIRDRVLPLVCQGISVEGVRGTSTREVVRRRSKTVKKSFINTVNLVE